MPNSTTTSDDPDRLWAPRTLAFFTAIVLANLVVDFAIVAAYAFLRVEASNSAPSRYISGLYEGVLFGLFSAQIVGLAIWAALFPGKSTLRWLAGTLVMFAGSVVLAMSVEGTLAFVWYWKGREFNTSLWDLWASALEDAANTLLLFHVAQIPFWIERRALGLRFTRDPGLSIPHDKPLRIVDLFGVVAFAAITMSLARFRQAEGDRFQLVLMIATVSTLMLVLGNSFLWAVFRIQSRGIRWLVCLALTQLFAWPFATFIFYVEQGQRGGKPAWQFFVLICQSVGFAIAVVALANGAAARAYGYRLISWPYWRRMKSAEQASPTSPPAASPLP